MFKITVKGRIHRYETLELAKKAAEAVFQRTGVVVGIEEA